MARKIPVQGFTLSYDDSFWRLEKNFDLRSTMNMGFDFEATLGNNAIHYKNSFGQSQNLPGTQVSTRVIDSVLVGYQKAGFWVLGLHLHPPNEEKLVFRSLVQWEAKPIESDRDAALQAAQALALILGRPLKIYGDKKTPTPQSDASRSGVTGPLIPHERHRIEAAEIAAYVKEQHLPITGMGFTLEESRNGLNLKLAKHQSRSVIETPLFNQCELNRKDQVIKLIPPTGLLGAFLRERGREVPFKALFNVEYRITQTKAIKKIKSPEGTYQEEISPLHIWGIYLTLKDESLLLLQASYEVSLKLKQAQLSVVGTSKLETNSAEGLRYFHEQLAEENMIEKLAQQTEWAAYELAHLLGKNLVITLVKG